ncbi:MAG: AI-2E family transporter [Eubacteriales bacterium]|nr:AI-2E family transporter [Eubacteriales bacterium]
MDNKKKREFLRQYIGWGVTIVVVSALVLLLFFCIYRSAALKSAIGNLIRILMPVIYGLVIAYLLAPMYDYLGRKLRSLFSEKLHWTSKRMEVVASVTAMFLTFAFMIAIVVGLLVLLIPRLITSISGIIATFPTTMNTMSLYVQQIFGGHANLEGPAVALYQQIYDYLQSWVQNDVVPQFQHMFSYFTDIVRNTVLFVKNILIGIVVAVYILANKTKFASQAKKLLYAAFDVRIGNIIMENIRFANEAFGGFLGGKIVDSAIIGVISWIGLSIMNMPYALILAVVIGVTNIIPFFGPFIGAVPCAILIFLVSPIKTLYFIIFIVVLQQFDGNILGPKILGKTTGISSFGVLFSIIFFGGLFGFVGMIIGVPLFVVIRHIMSYLVRESLVRKNLPLGAESYENLDHFDNEQHPIRMEVQEDAERTIDMDPDITSQTEEPDPGPPDAEQ